MVGTPFQKGKSGNPSGKKPLDPEFVKALKKASKPALEYIEGVIHDPSAEESTRLKAAIWILERQHGKAAQALELTDEGSQQMAAILKIVRKDAA